MHLDLQEKQHTPVGRKVQLFFFSWWYLKVGHLLTALCERISAYWMSLTITYSCKQTSCESELYSCGQFCRFFIFSLLFEASVLVSVCFRISFVYILRVKGFFFHLYNLPCCKLCLVPPWIFWFDEFFHCVNTRPTLTTTVLDRVA